MRNAVIGAVVLVNALTRVRGILTHRGLHFVLMGVTGIVVVASVVELAFEQHAHGANIHNFGESLWWAIVTVTTVGYGGYYPVTSGGRCVAVKQAGQIEFLEPVEGALQFVMRRALQMGRKLDSAVLAAAQAGPA